MNHYKSFKYKIKFRFIAKSDAFKYMTYIFNGVYSMLSTFNLIDKFTFVTILWVFFALFIEGFITKNINMNTPT